MHSSRHTKLSTLPRRGQTASTDFRTWSQTETGKTHLINLYFASCKFGKRPSELFCPHITDSNFLYSFDMIVFHIGAAEESNLTG